VASAAQNALQPFAYEETIGHAMRGREVLKHLPDTPVRTRHELAWQIALALAYAATAGWGAQETVQACVRADELCRQVPDTAQRLRVLSGLSVVYMIRAELRQARELGEEYLRMVRDSQESGSSWRGISVSGKSCTGVGTLPRPGGI
jgi:hypothetical protein